MGRLAAVIAMLGLTGCASMFNATIPAAQRRAEPSRRAQVLATAVALLEERGFTVVEHDPAMGVVRTDVAVQPGRVPCGFVTCRYRDAWLVSVDAAATVSVQLKRELSTPVVWGGGAVFMLSSDWVPPASTQTETVKGVEEAQVALLREILQ